MPKEQAKNLKPRPPIVVVMGHVDHGKTTLLDYIRKTNVAGREAGGITQSIGAYEIVHGQRKITFIDTPGHEAFSRMRSRGATVADLAVLVVAADESVKPQTKEAVQILKETETPFVVAITKVDKPNADEERVKKELTAMSVLLEGYGGQVSSEGVSATTGKGVNELLDLILLAADVEHLSFDPAAPASGFVLETKMDPRRGSEVTVIVKNGVLKAGEGIWTKTAAGKVKILEDFWGESVTQLEPSAPARMIGFETLPLVGEEFSTGEQPGGVRESPEKKGVPKVVVPQSETPSLNLVLKASDAGSLEALSLIVTNLKREVMTLHIVQESIGDVTDNDVKLAITTKATIIGFGNRVDKGARNLAEAHGIHIITSEVIYDLVKAIEDFLTALTRPVPQGELTVLAVFNQKKAEKQLVGGRVEKGVLRSKANFEILRNSESQPVGSGRILNLREEKRDITHAEQGKEVGLLVSATTLINVGDRLVVQK